MRSFRNPDSTLWSILFHGFIILMIVSTVRAEDSNYTEISLEELGQLEIYSASKYKQTLSETPSSVTVITSEDIKRYGYRDLGDILNSVTGFYKTYDRNYKYIGVRGFGRPGDYNSRILLLIDGHRINDNILNTGMTDLCFPLDVDLIDSVEVVRGPGSALYGGNAIFAVINVFTKSGFSYKGGEIAGEYGSGEAKRGRFTYGNQLPNELNYLVSGTYFDMAGERLYYPEFDDPSTNYGQINGDDETFKNLFFKVSYSDLTFEVASSKREKGIPTAPWETYFGDRRTRTWDENTFFGLTYEHEYDEDLSVLGRLSYQYYDYHGHYIYDDGGLYTNQDSQIGHWAIGEFMLIKQMNDSHKIVTGAETQYNFKQDQKNWDSDIYLDDQRQTRSWGIFIQDEILLTDTLTAFVGVRRDEYEYIGNSINPRAALIYKLTEDTTLKLMAGKAFRAPSAYELYYEDGSTTKANPQLDPETIKSYEAVLESNFNKNLKGTASIFYYELEDLIDQTVDPGDGMIVFENLSQPVTANGFELGIEGKWPGGLRGRLGYAYVDTFSKTTRSGLANSPMNMVNFNMIYPLLEDKLFAGIDVKYTGKRKTLDGTHTNDPIITNLTLTYENIIRHVDLQLGLYNLFDVNYDHPGFAEHTQDMLEQDERTFGLKLTYRF